VLLVAFLLLQASQSIEAVVFSLKYALHRALLKYETVGVAGEEP